MERMVLSPSTEMLGLGGPVYSLGRILPVGLGLLGGRD